MKKIYLVIIVALLNVDCFSMNDLSRFNELTRRDALGAYGLGTQIFDLSKKLKNMGGHEYVRPKLTYVEFVLAGYGDVSALEGAISMFIDLIGTSDDVIFFNPLNSERIEWTDPSLKVNMLLHVNTLRRLRLEESKKSEYARKEHQLGRNLLKIFSEKITSVDDLSSSADSSGDD